MKRTGIGFRGDRSCPFIIFVWDKDTGQETHLITLTPIQALDLGIKLILGFWSWIAGKKIIELEVDAPCSHEP